MKLDFWNNPIVVSSFRVRARKGNLMYWLVGYPVLLLLVGTAVPYFIPNVMKDWPRIAFYILMGLQFLLLGIMAGSATSASMKAEVAKQTLDFQRISSLSPRQILLGKLLAESATPFFLAVSTFPLGVMCYATGGPPLELLLLAYANLLFNVLLCGALGLVMQLELHGNKVQGGGLWVIPLFIELQSIGGLVAAGNWLITILCFLPLVQGLLAFLAFHVMERRLDNPMIPPVSRPVAYGLLAILDAAVAGLLYYIDRPFGQRAAIFCLAHLLLALMLIFSVTAWRESIKSWTWRFRGRLPWWQDSLLGNRSENAAAVVASTLIGLAALFLFVVLPGVYHCDRDEVARGWPAVAGGAVLTALLTLSLGTMYQWSMLVAGRGGAGVFVGFVLMLVLAPALAGLYLRSTESYGSARGQFVGRPVPLTGAGEPGSMDLPAWILSVSPAPHYGLWLSESEESLSLVPVLVLYGVLLAVAWHWLRRRLNMLARVIDRKLELMGALRRPGAEIPEVIPVS